MQSIIQSINRPIDHYQSIIQSIIQLTNHFNNSLINQSMTTTHKSIYQKPLSNQLIK